MRSFVTPRHLVLALPILAVLNGSARADYDEEIPPPPPAPAPAQRPMYTAPLAQTTQSTYVPQSVALSGPEEIKDFDRTRPIPDGYTMVTRPRKGLIIGGAVTLGVTWGISSMVAAIGEDTSSDGQNPVGAMWIPVAGPFIQLANTDSATAKVFLVGLGGAQLAGAVMLYYGMTSKKQVLVRNDLVGSLQISPYATNTSQGLAVSGRF